MVRSTESAPLVIVGAGSLGQSFAALLAQAGQPVVLLATPRSAERLRALGAITLRGAVDAHVPIASGLQVTADPHEIPHGAGLIFTPKGHHLPAAIEAVRHAAADRLAWAAGVQNGVVKDDLLAAAFGAERMLSAVTIFGAQRERDGAVRVSGRGMTYLGEPDGTASDRAQGAAAVLDAAGIPTAARPDMPSILWSKACNATGVFGITVLARVSNQQLFAQPDLMRAYLVLVRETALIARAYGIEVADVQGFPPIRTYATADPEAIVSRLAPPAAGPPSFASMTQDLLAGQPLEVESVFADIVERAERMSVPAPALRFVRDVIRGINPE
jgi:2-dehydropantoate 2-reductase